MLCDVAGMTRTLLLHGTELRYTLVMYLHVHGHATLAELVAILDYWGFAVDGRPSKTISDALRWEVARGRVRRFGRGVYGPGGMPRGTEHRIHRRVLALRAEAAELSLQAGQLA